MAIMRNTAIGYPAAVQRRPGVEVHPVDGADQGGATGWPPTRRSVDLLVLRQTCLGQRPHLLVLPLPDHGGGGHRQRVLRQLPERIPRSTTRATWSATSRRSRRNSTSPRYLSNPRSNTANMSGNGWVARWNSMTSRDGDHEIDADEQVQLPAPHPLDVIEVPRREQHHEQGRTVPLQLRAADAPKSRPAPAARATRTRWPPTGSPPRRAGTTRSRPARRGPAAPRRFPPDRADRRCGALDVHGVVDQRHHRSPPVPHLVNAGRAEGRLRGSRRPVGGRTDHTLSSRTRPAPSRGRQYFGCGCQCFVRICSALVVGF